MVPRFITISNSVCSFQGEYWTLCYKQHARLCFCAAICDFAPCQFATSLRLIGTHTWDVGTAKFSQQCGMVFYRRKIAAVVRFADFSVITCAFEIFLRCLFFMCSFAILVFNANKLIYLSTKFSTKADSFLSFILAFIIEKQHDFCLFM